LALAATAAMIATTLALAFGAEVGLAADYQDAKGNVCEGNGTFEPTKGCPEWGKHVTGFENVALGAELMPSLTSGGYNVALSHTALYHNTTGSGNLALGTAALESNTTGSDNVANGDQALRENTTGTENIAIGRYALGHNTTGGYNIASGTYALSRNTTGENNVASGFDALEANTGGSYNVASGYTALIDNTTGSENVALGYGAGYHLESGSHNIDISNEGVVGDAGTTRVGTEKTQTRAFVAGIYEKPITTPACIVKVNSEGQLGCNAGEKGSAGGAAIATFASFTDVPSGNCLNYTEVGGPGTASCPGKTSGFSAARLLAGPTPASGATVSKLYADSNASVSGFDTVFVAVIDNTTGATLLWCAVTSLTKSSCSNTGSSVPVAAGDNIEVKLTATGASGNNKQWRVRFRY
jgi:hypothetical protein